MPPANFILGTVLFVSVRASMVPSCFILQRANRVEISYGSQARWARVNHLPRSMHSLETEVDTGFN